VRIHGADVTAQAPSRRVRAGLCLIPEGRGIFRNLSVAENLRISTPPWISRPDLDAVYETFPILQERRKQTAGTLSGGQQQILALARASLAEAKLLLVDEVSMGLAPIVVDIIFGALQALAARGVALLLVEQYVDRALAMADSVYLIKKGVIRHAGSPLNLSAGNLMAEYMGAGTTSAEPRTSA